MISWHMADSNNTRSITKNCQVELIIDIFAKLSANTGFFSHKCRTAVTGHRGAFENLNQNLDLDLDLNSFPTIANSRSSSSPS